MDWISAIAFGGGISVVIALITLLIKYGKRSAEKEQLDKLVKVKDAQSQIAVDGVNAVDSLHNHDF